MNGRAVEFWVGVFVLAGFAALLFLAFKAGNLELGGGGEHYTVTARFNNIGGLKTRAPVRAAGVTVGRVVKIDFDGEAYQAEITMALASRYRFPRDTSASILTAGVLGENYIGLDAGADEAMLQPGDRIQITQSAVVLEQVISRFLYNKAQESGGS